MPYRSLAVRKATDCLITKPLCRAPVLFGFPPYKASKRQIWQCSCQPSRSEPHVAICVAFHWILFWIESAICQFIRKRDTLCRFKLRCRLLMLSCSDRIAKGGRIMLLGIFLKTTDCYKRSPVRSLRYFGPRYCSICTSILHSSLLGNTLLLEGIQQCEVHHQLACTFSALTVASFGKDCADLTKKPYRVHERGKASDSGRWFPGARLNIAESALSRENAGNPALIWAEEQSPTRLQKMTLADLRQKCRQVAAQLQSMGIKPGKTNPEINRS